MIKRLLLGLLALLLVLVLAVAVNTWRQDSRQIEVAALAPLPVDKAAAAQHLSVAIRARTVSSREDAALNADQFTQTTVREVFPGTLVTPGLYLAGSDSIHFVGLSDNVFRFWPIRVKPEGLPRLHGTNERISVDNLAELIRFYHRLLSVGARLS